MPTGADIYHAFERSAREVHGASAGFFQGRVVVIGSDANDEVVALDAARHVPVHQKGQTPKHLLFEHTTATLENFTNPLRELFVVGHEPIRKT
jgi:hypothetical protein